MTPLIGTLLGEAESWVSSTNYLSNPVVAKRWWCTGGRSGNHHPSCQTSINRSKSVAAPQCQVEQEGEEERQKDAHPTAGHPKSHRHGGLLRIAARRGAGGFHPCQNDACALRAYGW